MVAGISRYSFRARLVGVALLLAGALFMFALSSGLAPCSTVFAQSTSCSVGDTETFTGAVTFEDEVNIGATPGPGTSGDILTSQGAATAPEWLAGTSQKKTKTADESLANTAAIQDDDDLTFTVEANSNYLITAVLLVSAGTSGDFKFNFNLPASAIVDGVYLGELTVADFSEFSEAADEDVQVEDSAEHPIQLTATLQVAGTAGTATFEWAQQTSNASATTVHAGSVMTLQKAD